MSHVWLVKVKKTSLLVTILVVSVALLASCSSSTDEGSKASNKEETSTSGSTVRSEAEDTDSSEQAASSSNSEDQNQGEARASSEEVVVESGSGSPSYPDPPPQPAFIPGPPLEGYEWYQPDVDGDGVGSGFDGSWSYPIGKQPPGWVMFSAHWDNCPEVYNPNQEDYDNDRWGDVCDPEPLIPYNSTQAK